MFHVVSPQQAREIIDASFCVALQAEAVALPCAVNRILSEDILYGGDIPSFDRSSVDGYALRASDTFGASDTLPAMLRLAHEVHMGQTAKFCLSQGECAAIPTGGALPQGADAVVMLEYTEDPQDGFIYIHKSAAPGAGLVFRGDDAKAGELVLRKGRRLNAFDVGVLAACGYQQVSVSRLPRVGIISTGDEIAEQGQPLAPGQVYDTNAPALAAAMLGYGEPVMYGIVPDELDALLQTLKRAQRECDAVIITGGSSVGVRDNAKKALEALPATELFHGLALKPGKPTMLYNALGKPFFGLPGHPVAALMVFVTMVRRLLSSMMGEAVRIAPPLSAALTLNCPSNHGREEYVPVQLQTQADSIYAVPLAGKSGLITLLSQADGFFVIPRESEGFAQGKTVQVHLFSCL